jgi:hypothetical protein
MPVRFPLFAFSAALTLCLVAPVPVHAQDLTIGSQNVATADPVVPRPPTTPCVVNLYTNQTYADFSDHPFSYAPPANCPGPWQKVVLALDFDVTAGRQFDRTGVVWLNQVPIYFGTTQEPSAAVAPSWHIERDLTDYSALLGAAHDGTVSLGNFVGTSGGVAYTGIIHGSATLYFYPGGNQNTPRPDQVLAMNPGGMAYLYTPSSQLATTFASLPKNIERAFLDLYTQSQNQDEFWFFNLPDDIAPVFQDYGSTSFREAEISIDGTPAGVAPVYPWIYTGGADPILWRPIPGVQTLAFSPYRVDLTPFVGKLSDGASHTVAVSVYNAANYFATAGALLLYLDHGATQVTGNVTNNTLAATPQVNVIENVTTAPDGSGSGTVSVTSNRQYRISGTANTSHGLVTTTIDAKLAFSSVQTLQSDNTHYIQDAVQSTDMDQTTTRTPQSGKAFVVREQRHYPLTFDYDIVVADDGTETLHTLADQEFSQRVDAGQAGAAQKTAQLDNHVHNTVTRNYDANGNLVSAPASASQIYDYRDSFGTCYNRSITAQNRILASVNDGQTCPGGANALGWHDQFADWTTNFFGATLKLLP